MLTHNNIPVPSLTGGALNKSAAHFARPSGSDLQSRTENFLRWHDTRQEAGMWPYSRVVLGAPQAHCTVSNEAGHCADGINFANTDYLGLSTHPALREAAIRAIHEYGPHTPSSPMLQGNTGLSLELEAALADWLQMEHIVLFTTGWGAGFARSPRWCDRQTISLWIIWPMPVCSRGRTPRHKIFTSTRILM